MCIPLYCVHLFAWGLDSGNSATPATPCVHLCGDLHLAWGVHSWGASVMASEASLTCVAALWVDQLYCYCRGVYGAPRCRVVS